MAARVAQYPQPVPRVPSSCTGGTDLFMRIIFTAELAGGELSCVQMGGFEPPTPAPRAGVLPLHYIRIPGSALTWLSYRETATGTLGGFEPPTSPLVRTPGVEPGFSALRTRQITVFLDPD